jgi:hypothetical protein
MFARVKRLIRLILVRERVYSSNSLRSKKIAVLFIRIVFVVVFVGTVLWVSKGSFKSTRVPFVGPVCVGV